ncbi:hypothetical protein [Methylobacter psychrophilus]|jgi:hypothetical protein|uniref:hypothetical protein n=1 Tax=Methylobacter psychrophilus TaxID=96941 RepID=UPI0021D51B05|nr:hypothetical protein [Methylobacter psychrophilus]
MNIKQWLHAEYLPIALIALMALTRFHHFGDVLHLPDASLAVFFFAGFYRKKALLGFLLALAALIDTVAIQNGTSGWCVSPAYVFLIPTYAVMWLAGRYCATFKAMNIAELTKSVGLLTLAASAAFAISNGSFYLFSGRYTDLSWGQYFSRVAQYYPSYVGAALIYGVVGYVIVKLVKLLPELQSGHKQV